MLKDNTEGATNRGRRLCNISDVSVLNWWLISLSVTTVTAWPDACNTLLRSSSSERSYPRGKVSKGRAFKYCPTAPRLFSKRTRCTNTSTAQVRWKAAFNLSASTPPAFKVGMESIVSPYSGASSGREPGSGQRIL